MVLHLQFYRYEDKIFVWMLAVISIVTHINIYDHGYCYRLMLLKIFKFKKRLERNIYRWWSNRSQLIMTLTDPLWISYGMKALMIDLNVTVILQYDIVRYYDSNYYYYHKFILCINHIMLFSQCNCFPIIQSELPTIHSMKEAPEQFCRWHENLLFVTLWRYDLIRRQFHWCTCSWSWQTPTVIIVFW